MIARSHYGKAAAIRRNVEVVDNTVHNLLSDLARIYQANMKFGAIGAINRDLYCENDKK